MPSPQIGKLLILLGCAIAVAGLILLFLDRIPFLGRLPGDISFRHGHTSFYFPVVTCIVISVILTLLLNLLRK